MTTDALLIHLVVGNQIARKLIAAWPSCAGDDVEGWIKTAIANYCRTMAEEYRNTAEMLVKTGICKKGGGIDEFVAKYLNALAMKELGIRSPKK